MCTVQDSFSLFFFFNDTATTEIYTLSLHDALPISGEQLCRPARTPVLPTPAASGSDPGGAEPEDRKSTRLNSSHSQISYAVFCLKKKKKECPSLMHPTYESMHRSNCHCRYPSICCL